MLAITLSLSHAATAAEGTAQPGGGIWGNPFKGLSISARPSKPQYTLGEQIDVVLRRKNASQEPITLLDSGPLETYGVAAFYPDGRPLPKSQQLREAEAWIGKPRKPSRTSTWMKRLGPGEVSPGFIRITLNPWFKIDQEGTYLVLVMYNLGSWNKGFAVSNLVQFRITDGENNRGPGTEPSKAAPEKE